MTLVAFSMYTNAKNLFDMTKSKSSQSIECLNGLRSLSLLWIIFGHRYFDMFLAPSTNFKTATDSWLANIFSLSQTTFHLAVDTFLLMGGLLTTWSFMKSFDG
jgi:peptidoglycan/LPS O-acetylase OafA/YrhL